MDKNLINQAKLSWDRKLYEKFKIIRDKYNFPIVRKFQLWGITPNQLSWFRFYMAFAGLWLVGNIDWAWLIVYGIFLIIDSWDGALARLSQLTSKKGELLDMILDLLIKIFLVLRLLMVGYLDGFWGGVFISAFIIHIFAKSILAHKSQSTLPFFPESNLIIVFYAILATTNYNFLDYLFLVLGVYFWVKNVFLLNNFINEYSRN